MKLSKKQIIMSVFIVIILILLFVLFRNKFLSEPKSFSPVDNQVYLPTTKRTITKPINPAKIAKECQEIDDPIKKDQCLNISRRARAKHFLDCLEITDYKLRDDCIFRMARELPDIYQCQRIANHHLQEVCKGDVAIKTLNPNFCNTMKEEPHEYQECVDRVSAFMPSNDIKDCAEILTLEYQNLCFMHFNSAADCENI